MEFRDWMLLVALLANIVTAVAVTLTWRSLRREDTTERSRRAQRFAAIADEARALRERIESGAYETPGVVLRQSGDAMALAGRKVSKP